MKSELSDYRSAMTTKAAPNLDLTTTFHNYVSRGNKVSSSPSLSSHDSGGQREEGHKDHIYANFSGNNNNNNNNNPSRNVAADQTSKVPAEDGAQQAHKLKEMLLTQLDLIQRQREQLAQKDREVNLLREEKESLKVRLERMERRVSYLKEQHRKRKVSDMGLDTNPTSPNTASNANYNRIIGNASPTIGLGLSEDLDAKSLSKSRKRCRFSRESRKDAKSEYSSPFKNDFRWSKSSSSITSQSRLLDTNSNEKKNTLSQRLGILPRRLSSEVRPNDEMRTDKTYHTLMDKSSRFPLPENTKTYSTIEVPSWRFHPVNSCYQLEGTENIDDDIFLKRHAKLEIDEKRRKRWDIQILREQRHNEKLRRGRLASREARKNHEAERVSSFFPLTNEVQYIELSDTVPVVAFGCIIPDIKPNNFSLSWFSVTDRLKEEQTRSKKPKESRTLSRKGT